MGAKVGPCADDGYTVDNGPKEETVPVLGNVTFEEFLKPSAGLTYLMMPPQTNPCWTNVALSTLTSKDVMAEYPGFQWDPSKPWTPQEMQCWAWLSLQSGQSHPSRPFSQQYGFEPYLLI